MFLLQPIQAELLLWYPFDEGSGSMVSDARNGTNHLSASGSGLIWNQKPGAPFGGSIHFNGSASAVAQRTSVVTQGQTIDFLRARVSTGATIAFWANPDSQGQGTAPFSFLDQRSGLARILQSHLLWTNNNAYWDVGQPGTTDVYFRTNVATTSPPGQWTHWAFIFDGAAAQPLKIYRNNVLLLSAAGGTGSQVVWSDIDIAELGHSQLYGVRWAGSMDDFGLWDEALTPAQISTVFSGGVQALARPTIKSFLAAPGNIAAGGTSTLSWEVTNAASMTIDGGVGVITGGTGSIAVTPVATTTYTLTAANPAGSVQASILVGVNEPEQPLELTEFLADNQSGMEDEDGDRSDWIEIHNPNAFAVSTAGWRLADGTQEWVLPARQLEAGAYLVVFASGKDRSAAGSPLHTNFALEKDGEYLAFKRPDGSVVMEFAPAYPPQSKDISGAQAAGNAVYFSSPTPGAPNGPSFLGVVGDTIFSVERGFFGAPFAVEITCPTPGATIRYTTDHSTPDETNGTVYTGPVAINGHTVLRVRAFKPGHIPGNTDTQSYVFPSDVLNQVYSAPPAGWPASGVNGQSLRYGLNATLKAQYSPQQLLDALSAIPSVSIVTDQTHLTAAVSGIYVNALNKGDAWERPASVEYLPEVGADGFHINCGLRIRGGYSRNDQFPKHGLRLFFRNQYGEGNLRFPIFGTGGTNEFETIDLRCEQNYALANSTGTQNTCVREVFCRDLFGEMGYASTRSAYCHLYLNGQYWGLYQFEERPQEDFGADYFGGDPDDYDVVQTSNHTAFTYELSSGDLAAWQTTWNLARAHAASPTLANYFAIQGRDPSGTRVPGMPVYIDVDHLCAYMLLHYYTGDGDGPLSNFLQMNRANNWRGFRNRLDGGMGWQFFPHDCEHTLLADSWVNARATNNTMNGSNRSSFTYSNPEWMHEDLALNAEYRLRFADVAHRMMFNSGPLTAGPAQAVFDARAGQIASAILGEIVRWGQSATNHTQTQWQNRLNSIRSGFFASRRETVLGHLRTRGFYPPVEAPTWSQRGGQVQGGTVITLSAGTQAGTIYFTIDGSDPRALGGAVSPSAAAYTSGFIIADNNTRVRARFRASTGEWSALDEATFSLFAPAAAGQLVIGKIHYHPADEADTEFLELINISNQSIDMSAVTIGGGVTFSFGSSGFVSLAPGGRVVVVASSADFEARYGTDIPMAGQFDGSLNNAGESLVVTGAGGAEIVTLTYDDQAPWPALADGHGPALVLIDPGQNPDPNVATNWRASFLPGGSPGQTDAVTPASCRIAYFSAAELSDPDLEATVWGDLADPDADGMANLVEFALGGSAVAPGALPGLAATTHSAGGNTYLRLTALVRNGLSGMSLLCEGSPDAAAWQPGPTQVGATDQGDGTSIVTWQDTVPIGSSPNTRRLLRLRVTTP